MELTLCTQRTQSPCSQSSKAWSSLSNAEFTVELRVCISLNCLSAQSVQCLENLFFKY